MGDSIPPPADKGKQAHRRVGAYAKLLANYASDDAVIAAGEPAELLFVRGLAFCATSDSDGFITDAQVDRFVGAGMRDVAKRALRLTEVGLWERLDGGYLVRSWTKIHETAADKGRRLKADRERKRKSADDAAESESPSEQIPAGIQTEAVVESLSMTEHYTTPQRHDTTTGEDLGEQRLETLNPLDARCSAHQGVADPGPCRGCKEARESAERRQESRKRAARQAVRDCTECDENGFVLDGDTGMPVRRCALHRAAS